MKIEEIVGKRISTAREELGYSQPELGRLLGPLLGQVWPRQTVSGAERGKRAFTAGELVAFAMVLKVPVGYLLAPLAGVDTIELASGATVSVDSMHESSLPDDPAREVVHDMGRAVVDLQEKLEQAMGLVGTLAMQVDQANTALAEDGG